MVDGRDLRVVSIHYGEDEREVRVPRRRLLEELGMKEVDPADRPHAVLETALDEPVGSAPLEVLARGKNKAVLVVDDITRPTPVHKLLPGIVERILDGGISKDSICVLIATGTHRAMSPSEIESKVGAQVSEHLPVKNHDYRSREDLAFLGHTPGGIPITVNRLLAEEDAISVAVGNIVPHRYCGWGGGAKIVLPGVSDEHGIAASHLMISRDPSACLGAVENSVRCEMEAAAARTNLAFLVNTILNRHSRIVSIVAGCPRAAFREGVKRAQGVYQVEASGVAEVVLASAYPSDLNLWQAGKALYSAEVLVRESGVIILASPCYEGIGEHEAFMNLLECDPDSIKEMINSRTVEDRVGACAAFAVALVRKRAQVWLVSEGISADEAARMGMWCFDSIQEAVDTALNSRGEGAQLTVLHEATEVLPTLSG
jgi:nickel-dependent lactate racemase